MTKLSVNINKIALLRNSRGGNIPDLLRFAEDCERYGADGITVHPRPDERHIRKTDVYALKEVLKTELNIEGYPSDDFLKMVEEVSPHQCTLVPDEPGQLTSDRGWDVIRYASFLKEVVQRLQEKKIRVSLFVDPVKQIIEQAKKTDADRIEFFTGPYAHNFFADKENAVKPYADAAVFCNEIGIGINAGHDLNLDNLKFFRKNIPMLLEVSIGHALVRDCLYFGLENTVRMYKRELQHE